MVAHNLEAAILTAATELIVVAALFGGLLALLALFSRTTTAGRDDVVGMLGRRATRRLRRLVITTGLLAVVVVLCYNGWLLAIGLDARAHTTGILRSITAEYARTLAIGLAKIALLAVALVIATRLVRRVLREVEDLVAQFSPFDDEHGALPRVFAALARALVSTAWLLAIAFSCQLLSVWPPIVQALVTLVRVWAVVAFGIPVILSTTLIVAALDRLVQRYALSRGWGRYYEHLHALLPTFRACLDYALWIALATLALMQVTWLQRIAAWGPILIEAVAIFFFGQVVIQLGYLEIGHRMLPHDGLEENERRRRATMVPLVRSAFMYAAYFGTAVLILSAMGFNPMPFLAGAGILGLVVGFGAQSMINDVVSGFFILFENIYLVGDVIDIGSSSGVVEAIEFRTTKIRDPDGRLHIVRNGDMKMVVNYSKDYAVAVVALDVGYDADLRAVFASLRQAGERLRAESPEIVGDTQIDGITAFGPSTMTVRTSTRVKPGCHLAMAAKLRLQIKETFDPETGETLRKTLIPEKWPPAAHHEPMMRAADEPQRRRY